VENHGKIPCGQLVSIKTHNNIQKLENGLKGILPQISPEKLRGLLNKKFA